MQHPLLPAAAWAADKTSAAHAALVLRPTKVELAISALGNLLS